MMFSASRNKVLPESGQDCKLVLIVLSCSVVNCLPIGAVVRISCQKLFARMDMTTAPEPDLSIPGSKFTV